MRFWSKKVLRLLKQEAGKQTIGESCIFMPVHNTYSQRIQGQPGINVSCGYRRTQLWQYYLLLWTGWLHIDDSAFYWGNPEEPERIYIGNIRTWKICMDSKEHCCFGSANSCQRSPWNMESWLNRQWSHTTPAHCSHRQFEEANNVIYRLSHATTCRFEVPTKVFCQLSQDVQLNFTERNRWSLW